MAEPKSYYVEDRSLGVSAEVEAPDTKKARTTFVDYLQIDRNLIEWGDRSAVRKRLMVDRIDPASVSDVPVISYYHKTAEPVEDLDIPTTPQSQSIDVDPEDNYLRETYSTPVPTMQVRTGPDPLSVTGPRPAIETGAEEELFIQKPMDEEAEPNGMLKPASVSPIMQLSRKTGGV